MIILLGFPKSGTSSFQKLFSDLSYNSYHWKKNGEHIGMLIKNNKINNKPLLSNFLKSDCITQMDVCDDKINNYWPQIIDYERIYYENSDSIFILNKRDPEKLLSSFKRWGKLNNRIFKYCPYLLTNDSDEALYELINRHYNNIESFFSLHPKSKFIIYDIENDKIEKLKKYIDIKGIKIFPKMNVNSTKI
jgi:hypothetical protein